MPEWFKIIYPPQSHGLDPDFFKRVIDQLYKKILYLTFYFQGEPFLNPEFLEMVKYASSKKIYTTASTNLLHFLDDDVAKTVASGLDRLIISIDGTTQETSTSLMENRRNTAKGFGWSKEYCEMEKRIKI